MFQIDGAMVLNRLRTKYSKLRPEKKKKWIQKALAAVPDYEVRKRCLAFVMQLCVCVYIANMHVCACRCVCVCITLYAGVCVHASKIVLGSCGTAIHDLVVACRRKCVAIRFIIQSSSPHPKKCD